MDIGSTKTKELLTLGVDTPKAKTHFKQLGTHDVISDQLAKHLQPNMLVPR